VVCAFPPSHGHPVNKELGGLTEFNCWPSPLACCRQSRHDGAWQQPLLASWQSSSLRRQLLLGWGLGLGSSNTCGLCGCGGSCWRIKDKHRGLGCRHCRMIRNASQVCSIRSWVDQVGLELCQTPFAVEDLAVKNNQRQTGEGAFAATKAPSSSGFSRLTW